MSLQPTAPEIKDARDGLFIAVDLQKLNKWEGRKGMPNTHDSSTRSGGRLRGHDAPKCGSISKDWHLYINQAVRSEENSMVMRVSLEHIKPRLPRRKAFLAVKRDSIGSR